jgi:hypothetical protein
MIESPFLTGDRIPTTGDLAAALVICTTTKKSGLVRYERFCNSRLARAYWFCRFMCQDMDRAIEDFNEYVKAYFEYPEIWAKQSKAEATQRGAPGVWVLVTSLSIYIAEKAVDELWDIPLVYGMCLKAVFDEHEGGPEIAYRLEKERNRNAKV